MVPVNSIKVRDTRRGLNLLMAHYGMITGLVAVASAPHFELVFTAVHKRGSVQRLQSQISSNSYGDVKQLIGLSCCCSGRKRLC